MADDKRILKCDFCSETMPVAQLNGCDNCGAQWCDLCDTKHKNYCNNIEICSLCGQAILLGDDSVKNHRCIPIA